MRFLGLYIAVQYGTSSTAYHISFKNWNVRVDFFAGSQVTSGIESSIHTLTEQNHRWYQITVVYCKVSCYHHFCSPFFLRTYKARIHAVFSNIRMKWLPEAQLTTLRKLMKSKKICKSYPVIQTLKGCYSTLYNLWNVIFNFVQHILIAFRLPSPLSLFKYSDD